MIRHLVLCGLSMALAVALGGGARADNAAPAAPPLKIMPAPAPVTIDGDLGEWNLEGKLGPETFDPDVKDDYNATCYAMWDADNLYLAAVIVEPHPPYNTFPVKGVGDWNGDDVIIRMSSNPARAWPIAGSPESFQKDPDLFTGSFWWNHLKKRTYWGCYHGMDIAEVVAEAGAGTQVAVKPAADGKGYTEEIKLPWKTINPNYHPRAGDRIAFSWEISVGSANPGEPGRAFQIFLNGGGSDAFRTPTLWGQAVVAAAP